MRADSGTTWGTPSSARSRPVTGTYCSTTTCALVPLWPKELTAAINGTSAGCRHGPAVASATNAEPVRSISGLRSRSVGMPRAGLYRIESSTLIMPTTPAGAPVWPMCALALPSAANPRSPVSRRNARTSAFASTGSPSAVPVPWASTYPTRSAGMPKRR
ncbi:hypothetical protein SALBM135S_05961 [Streptomyces alboniger]